MIFSLDHVFTELQNDKHTVRDDSVRVLLHGHSILDEATFYELYMTNVINSKDGLENYLRNFIPGFQGLTQQKFDEIMSTWMFHMLAQ